jgi:hypothetical protein
MKFNMTGSEKCDLFNTGYCLIEMITWAGLTVLLIEMTTWAGLTVLLIEMTTWAGLTVLFNCPYQERPYFHCRIGGIIKGGLPCIVIIITENSGYTVDTTDTIIVDHYMAGIM